MMHRNIAILFVAALLITGLQTTAFSQSPQGVRVKVGVVDFQRIYAESLAAKSLAEQVAAQRSAYQATVQSEQEKLRTIDQDLTQKRSLLAPEAFDAERRQAQQEAVTIQRTLQEQQRDIQTAANNAKQEIDTALNRILVDFSTTNQFTLLLRRDQLVLSHEGLDITNDIIIELDKVLPRVEVTRVAN